MVQEQTPEGDARNTPGDEIVVLCDSTDCIRFVNRTFASVFGASPQDWYGQNFAPGATTDEMRSTFRTVARTKSGEQIVEWHREALSTGEILYSGALITNDAARKTDGRRDRRAKKALNIPQIENDQSGLFLATMSHEMRTPLNGILGMAGLLLDTELDLNQKSYVEAMEQSGKSLLTLINDILDYSKLGAGKLELEESTFDPYALIQRVTELLAPRAAEKQIEIASYVDPSTPHRLVGDENRLRQVILNLAGNAVKFTAKGGVAIEASVNKGAGEKAALEIIVRDTGVGIPEEDLGSIFEEFNQTENTAARRGEGTGLGLAISKRLAKVMSGDITVQSKLFQGSVFTFSSAVVIESEPTMSPKISAPPVVIATKSQTLNRILRLQLQSFGVSSIRSVNDAYELSAAVRETENALLICDYSIAAECEKAGQGNFITHAARSLVLLAAGDRPAIAAMRTMGFDGYLIKPVRQTTLMREVSRGDLEPEPETKPTTKNTKPNRSLNVLLAEDNQINAVLATAIIKRGGHKVHVATNGAEAVEAAKAGGYDLIFMDMHMPEMDGLEASQNIRCLDGAVSQTPIVALTANAMPSDRNKCLEVGMNDFLAKPFEPEQINEMLVKWCEIEEFEEAS